MKKTLLMHVHATSQNKGDHALLISLLKLLKSNVEVIDVCTQSESHENVVEYLNIKNMGSASNFFAFLLALRKSDALILGGGDVITASNNLLLLAMARITHTPTFFVGAGVNLKHVSKLGMLFLKYSLPNVALAFIRDSNSAKKLIELGLNQSQLTEVSDLTFAHGAKLLTPQYRNCTLDLPDKFIAMSIRSPEFNSSKWGTKEYKNIAVTLDRIISTYGMNVVFVSMADEYNTVSKGGNSSDEIADTYICEIIQSHMTNKNSTQIITSAVSLDEVMSIFDRAHMAICCRLHAMIFSTLVATPFIGLTYNLKSESYLSDAGISDCGLPLQELTAEGLYSKFDKIMGNYDLAVEQTQKACDLFIDKATSYGRLSELIVQRKPRSRWRLLHPKLWILYTINFLYEIYTKLTR
ncbi:polysaccharide pyruvyl transferase family protein [Alteromonas marina]